MSTLFPAAKFPSFTPEQLALAEKRANAISRWVALHEAFSSALKLDQAAALLDPASFLGTDFEDFYSTAKDVTCTLTKHVDHLYTL